MKARTIELAGFDEWSGQLECPICERVLSVGTPRIPLDSIEGQAAADGGKLPVFGARCDRHRESVFLPAPADVAPESFDVVDAEISGEYQTIALPKPVLSCGDSE